MANKNKKTGKNSGSRIAVNKKARHDYTIEKTFEAGLVLEGWEVKSIRDGRVQMTDTYVMVKGNEIFWLGGQITALLSASTHVNPEPSRARKLLMHRYEIDKLIGAVERKGYTLVPLKMYWGKGSHVKLEIGLAKGKQLHDKRADEKDRDWNRDKARILKGSHHK
ncbi:tmRNA-binding protein SmpB [hydrothermal vent metagenome]|uniref:TmRNA-binding protein SmpB n=1 Tax=hydrothermal vent metagenome TaxID=652676 RepID=A0A3B0XYF3_9ZZZZ